VGLAIVRRRPWALKRRFIPFVRSIHVKALAASPPLEELLEIIGAGRAAHGAARVTAAEAEVRERLARAHGDHVRRVRRWGLIAIIIGAYYLIMNSLMLVSMAGMTFAGRGPYPAWGADAAADLHFCMMCGMGTINVGFGVALLVCGLGLRKRRDWAPRGLIWSLWLYFAAGLSLVPFIFGWMRLTGAQWQDLAIMLALTPLSIAFWALVFRSMTKALRRPATRDVCGSRVARAYVPFAPKARRSILVAAILVIAIPLLAVVVAYGVWRHKAAAAWQEDLAALRQSGAVLALAQWQPTPPPSEDNAAALLRDAADETQQAERAVGDAGRPAPTMPDGEPLEDCTDLVELAAWTPEHAGCAQRFLAANADALGLLRGASALPHADFGWDYSEPFLELDGLCELRNGVRLLCLSARVAHGMHDDVTALTDLVAAVRLAGFPDRDPILVVITSRASSLRLAARCGESLLRESDIPAEQLDSLERALHASADRLGFGRAMACERAFLLTVWGEIRSGQLWEAVDLRPPGRLKAFLARPFLDSRMAAALPLVNEAVQHAEAPPWEAFRTMEELDWEIDGMVGRQERTASLIGRLPNPISLVGAYGYGTRAYVDCLALVDSLRVAIALRRFAADNVAPATALADLVPEYLPEVPLDPFTGGQLHVKRDDGLVTVYSVGRNGEDDGGDLARDPEHRTRPDTGVRIRE
jgi:hypothetical protein